MMHSGNAAAGSISVCDHTHKTCVCVVYYSTIGTNCGGSALDEVLEQEPKKNFQTTDFTEELCRKGPRTGFR